MPIQHDLLMSLYVSSAPLNPGKYFRVNGKLKPAEESRVKAIEELAEFLGQDFDQVFSEMGGVTLTLRIRSQ